MEYIFGRDNFSGNETLKTKGNEHTNLEGFVDTVREYDDCKITDSFFVDRKEHSTEDIEGNCYDWYVINRHYRVVDKSGPIVARVDGNKADIEAALCDMDEANEAAHAAYETALCDIDELMNGGNTDE